MDGKEVLEVIDKQLQALSYLQNYVERNMPRGVNVSEEYRLWMMTGDAAAKLVRLRRHFDPSRAILPSEFDELSKGDTNGTPHHT